MSVNKVILIGNVGKDPEVRYLDGGTAVASLTLATSERGYTATNGTVVPERTEWHNLSVWRSTAEFVEKYVRKGSQIYVEGRIKTRSYDDQQGNKRYVTEIQVENLQLLGRKQDDGGQPNTSVAAAKPAEAPSFDAPAGTNDDLPF